MSTSVSGITLVKNVSYIPALFVGLSFESYTILAVFMVLDTILGVIKAAVLSHEGEKVVSYRLKSGILSKISVMLVPLLLAWTGRGIGLDLVAVAQATLALLILSEFYSILGNIYSIYTRKKVDEFDAIGWILRILRDRIERTLKDNMDIK